jgi:branched-chain amino acid transport system permease protein
MSSAARLRTDYGQEFALANTPGKRRALFALAALAVLFPLVSTPFLLDLCNQVLLTSIGAVALMLLTGYAGQISLGHAGFLAAGAFTVGVLFKEFGAPFWVTLPAAALVGALLGLLFGLPSLRLRGLYLGISTLGLHFVVIYLGNEYQSRRGLDTGVLVDPPSIAGYVLRGERAWYVVLLLAAAASVLFSLNLLRSRVGRAWRALREREVVAEALGIDVPRAKLSAFVVSSVMTALAGALFAYFRSFVSIDAFDLYLGIQYVAMVIVGGMGSILGAVLGAAFVVLFPYAIEAAAGWLPQRFATQVFALDYAAFGAVMIFFLLFEPQGLVGLLRRGLNYFRLWPFRQVSREGL